MHHWHDIRERYGGLVWASVFRIIKHHDQALDCYQDVFLEAFEHSKEKPIQNWPAFLRWLAVRRALDRLRKERRAVARMNTYKEAVLSATEPSPSDDAELRELVDRVRLETAQLPDQQAEAFWLRCVEGMSYADVASQMGTDVNCVGVLLHRARTRLRESLADLNPARARD